MHRALRTILLVILFIIILVIMREIRKPKSLTTKATVGSAKVFIVPESTTMPPAGVFQVWATTDRPTVFAHVVLRFDPQIIHLSQEISFENTPLSRIVQVTPMVEANNNGTIVMAMALDPAHRDTPPNNTYRLGSLHFISNTDTVNAPVNIAPVDTLIKIVQPDSSVFAITTQAASLIVNPDLSTPVAPSDTPGISVSPSPSISPSPPIFTDVAFDLRIRLNGVTGGNAEGAQVTVRFVKESLDLITPFLPIVYLDDGVYSLRFTTTTSYLTPGSGYTLILKGEKHVSRKYCFATGQTGICKSTDNLTIPNPDGNPILFDFTGVPLAPGDLYTQDGRADLNDFSNMRNRMTTLCDELSTHDKLVADVNYNGCVDTLDAYWIRNTLETRYDEN